MPMTPTDVQQKTFRVALRGYAEDEVDEFLDEVVLSIREYEQRLEELSFQVGSLESELAETRHTEDAMRRTLLLAERTAAEITEEARRDAERIVSEARTTANSLTAEQAQERQELLAELHRLRDIVTDVRERLGDVTRDTQSRLAPVSSQIDRTLDEYEDQDHEPEPADSRPELHAVDDTDEWSEGDESDDAETEDWDSGDGTYWDRGADRSDGSDDAETDGGELDESVAAASDEVDDVADEADELATDARDEAEDLGTRRRPWERFSD